MNNKGKRNMYGLNLYHVNPNLPSRLPLALETAVSVHWPGSQPLYGQAPLFVPLTPPGEGAKNEEKNH